MLLSFPLPLSLAAKALQKARLIYSNTETDSDAIRSSFQQLIASVRSQTIETRDKDEMNMMSS
jgi:hypothetical protein